MTGIYLMAALFVNLYGVSARFTDGINTCFNSALSGTQIFFVGLAITLANDILGGLL